MKKYNYSLLEAVPPDYYQTGTKHNFLQKIWHGWKWQSLRQLLDGLSGMILDVGCASGMLTDKIKKESPEARVFGVDLYKEAITYAQRNYPNITFEVADAHKLPFPARTFDVVIATETLEHLHDPQSAIREIWRILKPEGIFIVGQDTDNWLFRLIWWLWTKSKGKVWRGVHVSCMNPQELSSLLQISGFKIEKQVFSHLGLEVFLKARKAK